jgi:hypothetical protein
VRIEGDTQANLFFVDASLDNIGIASSNPANFRLQVAGNVGPDANNTYDLGSAANKWSNIYTSSLNADTLTLSFTKGSIVHADVNGNLAQDNAAFYYDYTNNHVGIGTSSPSTGLDIGGVTTNHALTGNADVLVAGSVEIANNLFVDGSAILAGTLAVSDNGNFTKDLTIGDDLVVADAVNFSSFTANSILFTGTSGVVSEDTANFIYDNTNNALILGGTSVATADTALFANGKTIFNEQGLATADIRIEGDTQGNLLFVDASTNKVGIATSAPNSDLDVAGSLSLSIKTVTTSYAVLAQDHTVIINGTVGTETITLPTASGITGRIYVIKRIDANAGTIVIDANGAETIDGSLTESLVNQYDSVTLQSDGSNWFIL